MCLPGVEEGDDDGDGDGDGLVGVGDAELVGVGELLAEADGLADCEVFGDDVGLTDFVGLGLPTVGLGGSCGCTTTTLEGVGLGRGLTVLGDGADAR